MPVFRSPGNRTPRFYAPTATFVRWAFLPYGMWITADGGEILFNRFYEPIWRRHPPANPTPADPTEWVKYKTQSYFYDDGVSEPAMRRAALKVLSQWGIPYPDATLARNYRE